MAHIHARELTTGDLAYRWIDDLVTGYGVDPEVTALMDSTEMWVVPVVNPDGLSIVQRGGNAPYLQRKNARPTSTRCANPPTSSSQAGVDLNRNYGVRWGGAGTSTNTCAQTYPGARADSEPETAALEALFTRLFADQRGPGAGDAAPATTRGTMITLHSYSNLILFPWGYDSRVKAPNDAGLRALAARLAGITGYRYGQPGEILYNASGGTDDWTYDRLGIASFTFEVGPTSGTCGGFTPPYSCQASTFWPLVKPALRYAARTAGSPYRLPAAARAA